MIDTPTLKPWEQLPMYAVSEELAPRVEALGLAPNLVDLQENGYTVISVGTALTDRLREAILASTADSSDSNATFDRACAQPIGDDPVYDEATTQPAVLALAEYICGRGFVLSSLLATVRVAGSALPLHCDQGHLPVPFPEHLGFLTACWVTDEFTKENGATYMLPGTQKHRRPPSPAESRAAAADAVAIEAPAGSVLIWDGSVWHGNFPRTTDGERVVLHASYSRLAYAPVHDFGYVTEEYLASAPAEMRRLLGGDLGFRTNLRNRHIDEERFIKMSQDVRR